jgi:perosamine synthetase
VGHNLAKCKIALFFPPQTIRQAARNSGLEKKLIICWWNTGFGEAEATVAANVVRSGYLNEGSLTREFEKQLGEFLKVKFVKAVPSGTTAISIALWAVGIQPGEEVLVPNTTFMASASGIHMTGATPVLVDVYRHDFNINVDDLVSKISKKTRAILIVHINGRPADIARLQEIHQKYKIPIVEDTAQGLGSSHKGQFLGTIFDIGCISLAPSKVISTGQGGLVLTNSSALHDNVIYLKDHGRLARTEIHHPRPGYNFKFTDVQAAIGIEQIKVLPERLRKAKDDYTFYRESLRDVPGILVVPIDLEAGHIPLWIDTWVENRPALMAHLKSLEIYPQPFWEPLHQQWIPSKGSFPVSTEVCAHGMWLPSGPWGRIEDMRTVSQQIRKFLGV